MEIALFSINSASVEPLVEDTIATRTMRYAIHGPCWWEVFFSRVLAWHSMKVMKAPRRLDEQLYPKLMGNFRGKPVCRERHCGRFHSRI